MFVSDWRHSKGRTNGSERQRVEAWGLSHAPKFASPTHSALTLTGPNCKILSLFFKKSAKIRCYIVLRPSLIWSFLDNSWADLTLTLITSVKVREAFQDNKYSNSWEAFIHCAPLPWRKHLLCIYAKLSNTSSVSGFVAEVIWSLPEKLLPLIDVSLCNCKTAEMGAIPVHVLQWGFSKCPELGTRNCIAPPCWLEVFAGITGAAEEAELFCLRSHREVWGLVNQSSV